MSTDLRAATRRWLHHVAPAAGLLTAAAVTGVIVAVAGHAELPAAGVILVQLVALQGLGLVWLGRADPERLSELEDRSPAHQFALFGLLAGVLVPTGAALLIAQLAAAAIAGLVWRFKRE